MGTFFETQCMSVLQCCHGVSNKLLFPCFFAIIIINVVVVVADFVMPERLVGDGCITFLISSCIPQVCEHG